jgi:Cu-processing system permease protein
LMGYTGALYKDFFGGLWGMLFTAGIMFLWVIVPLWLAVKRFNKKDL